jgi:pimeloyl-ACP methyl ester carboxylesterase
MDVILIPGLWLDASTWEAMVPDIERAGHIAHPLTMPGVGAAASESSDVGIADWVAATVAEIDRLPGRVVVVGHSGGGNVAYGAVDARPERVARVIFVDTFPPGDGGSIWEFPVVDGVIPFPGWDSFDEGEVADLDSETRADAAARALPVPRRVPTDPIRLSDERRRTVPATMITATVPEADIRAILADPPEWAAELAALERLDVVQLNDDGEPTGHWPQFSQPQRLAAAIVAAIG